VHVRSWVRPLSGRWTRSSEWSVAKTGGQTGQHSITLEKTLFIKIVTIEP